MPAEVATGRPARVFSIGRVDTLSQRFSRMIAAKQARVEAERRRGPAELRVMPRRRTRKTLKANSS